ncbi:MAG: thioredoxin domain-containing protein [Dehalococcoidia bacterium]|nr:thioredoxin domain-containing protein [Dehalococcoidia bacterium]
MRARWLALAAAFTAMALIAAACGGDDDGGGETATAASGATVASGTASPGAKASASPVTVGEAIARMKAFEPAAGLADGAALGKKDSKVVLGVFEDFQCPVCLAFTLLNEPVIMDEYVQTGKIRFEFLHMPILGPESANAAIGGVCAAQQNKFWPYHKKLFVTQAEAGQLSEEKLNVGRFTPENLKKYAGEAGLDATAFETCLKGDGAAAEATNQLRQARDLGVRGTPTFVLNGKVLSPTPPDAAAWRKVLDEALAK